MRPRTREEVAAAWGMDVDDVPVRGVKRKRRGVTFVNQAAVAGVVDYLAFEYPVGTGRTWRVAPIAYLAGQKIAALELDLLDVHEQLKAAQDRGAVGVPILRELHDQYNRVISRGIQVAGPLMIPTGKRKRWLRLRKRFGWNPLKRATDKDVAAVIGFLARCLMNSQSRVSQAAVLN